ncbi:MAG: MarR family transcriptional regulator [Desulfocapsa sp.]|nr:MarR family transcriptional regulator [Desulfocapsa sp.]
MKTCDEKSVGRQLYLTNQAMTNHAERALKPYGITLEQFVLLKNISENDGLSQNQLCEIVEKSPANVTRILDRLEKKSFIKRKQNPADRRSTLVVITDQGMEMADKVHTLFESFSEHLTKGISSQEQDNFMNILDIIRGNLDQLTDKSFS